MIFEEDFRFFPEGEDPEEADGYGARLVSLVVRRGSKLCRKLLRAYRLSQKRVLPEAQAATEAKKAKEKENPNRNQDSITAAPEAAATRQYQ